MKTVFIIILLAASTFSQGQPSSLPIIKNSGTLIEDFIPKNWRILQKVVGDLNKDKLDDVVLVLQEEDKTKIETLKGEEGDYTIDFNQRLLIVLCKDSTTNGFNLKGRTNTFIINRHSENMADPLQEIVISNGILKINFFLWYSMGSWYQTELTYIFRFQNNQVSLIGAEYNEIHRGTSEGVKRSFNFSTKKMSETKSHLNDEGDTVSDETKWMTLPINKLRTLETLTQPLDWRIFEGIQI